jgi:hypothetical protein
MVAESLPRVEPASSVDRRLPLQLAIGVAIIALVHLWVFTAGRYIAAWDWAQHVGLAAVLADGPATGADAFYDRRFRPGPYLLFYLLTTGGIRLGVSAERAALVVLILPAIGWSIAAIRFCKTFHRDPRMGLIAPLAMFGMPFAKGFASFVVAEPMMLFVIGDLERMIREPTPKRTAVLALELAIAFLGHGLVFLFCCVFVGARLVLYAVTAVHTRIGPNRLGSMGGPALPDRDPRIGSKRLGSMGGPALPDRDPRHGSWRVPLLAAASFVPALVLSLWTLLPRIEHPHVNPAYVKQGHHPSDIGIWIPLKETAGSIPETLGYHTGDDHDRTLWMALGVLAIWWALTFAKKQRFDRPDIPVIAYALIAASLFLFSPNTLLWPVQFWLTGHRMVMISMLLLFLLPKPRLDKGLALLGLAVVVYNGWAIHNRIAAFSATAAPFDVVRTSVPTGARVLGIRERDQGYLGGFHMLLLASGAAYVNTLDFPTEQPVSRKEGFNPAYVENAPEYKPKLHSKDYDYVLLIGAKEHNRLSDLPGHRLVKIAEPFAIYALDHAAIDAAPE